MFGSIISKMNLDVSSRVFYWDVGTLNCRLYTIEEGLVADQPAVFLLHSQTKEIYYQGDQAYLLMEKIPPGLVCKRGIVQGKIAEPIMSALFDEMMGHFSSGLMGKITRPLAVVTVPADIDPVHARALKQAFLASGFGSVLQIPHAAAACVSFDPVSMDGGMLICDCGAGKTEITAMGSGDVVAYELIPQGGDKLDQIIQDYVKISHQLLIPLAGARQLKHAFSFNKRKNKEIFLLGKNLKTSKIESLGINPEELRKVIEPFLENILLHLDSLMMNLPSALAAALRERGILLTGGLSQIDGLDTWITDKTQFAVHRLPRQHISPLLGLVKIKSQWNKYSYLKVNLDD